MSELVGDLKRDSSKWIKTTGDTSQNFHWQDGYGAFTVSKSKVPEVIRYIQTQREHHQGKTFADEYLELLRLHEVEYDVRYVWG